MVAAGSLHVQYRTLAARNAFHAGPGSVTIWPAGHELKSASWTSRHTGVGATELIKVRMDTAAFKCLAPECDPVRDASLRQQCAIIDPALTSLVRLMEADVAAGCPSGNLYGESLSLALAAHVTGRYSVKPEDPSSVKGLTGAVLDRILNYIRTHLDGELRITELATMANLSPHHFSLRFKESVGLAPHQWVVRTRVHEAKRLLEIGKLSVAEIALGVGFSSQSHFTAAFRRLTGTTPMRYRSLC